MKPCVFTGSAVAIVTPFCGDGVDLEAFDRLIERQIQGGPRRCRVRHDRRGRDAELQ